MFRVVRTLSAIWQSHSRAPCPYSTGPAVNNMFVDDLVHIRALPQLQISDDKASNVEIYLVADEETVLQGTEGALSGQEIRAMYVISREPSR